MVGSRQGLLLTLLVRASLVAGLARRADKAALIDLYRLLDGPNWFNNDGWDPDGGADPCSFESRWRGVGCIDPCDIYRDGPTCAFGRITALNLRDNNLTGSITNWTGIGDLHNLSWVDLSVNAISGSLPAEIGQVQNVEVLNMAWNQLEGGLPTTIGALNSNGYAQINELTFEFNRMEGTLPSELGLLTKLRMFNFHHNRISGSIPAQLTDLTDLQVMYVSGNQLDGTLPDELGKLSALRFLNASDNDISGTLPASVGALSSLNDLSLFSNSLSGSLPLELGNLHPLRYLRMQDNRLQGNFTRFNTLGNLRQLVTLDLYNNQMDGDVPPAIQNLTSLQYLYLDVQHYKPLRQKYCRQRLPNNGKYNYRIVRDEYLQMTSVVCEDMHDTNFAFNSLQSSAVYPE
jgi:Leucine-rich repeat (LRR) protein